MQQINLKIFGMVCEGCTNVVKLTLKKHPSVKNVDVDLLPPLARILCDDNIQPYELIKFLEENTNYKALVKVD